MRRMSLSPLVPIFFFVLFAFPKPLHALNTVREKGNS